MSSTLLDMPLDVNNKNEPDYWLSDSCNQHKLTDSPFFSSVHMVGLRVILADPSIAPAELNVIPSFVHEIDMESPNWDRSRTMRWNSEDNMFTTTLGAVSCVTREGDRKDNYYKSRIDTHRNGQVFSINIHQLHVKCCHLIWVCMWNRRTTFLGPLEYMYLPKPL